MKEPSQMKMDKVQHDTLETVMGDNENAVKQVGNDIEYQRTKYNSKLEEMQAGDAESDYENPIKNAHEGFECNYEYPQSNVIQIGEVCTTKTETLKTQEPGEDTQPQAADGDSNTSWDGSEVFYETIPEYLE